MANFKSGDKVIVHDTRKGVFKGTVLKDFDTDQDEWYQIALRQDYLEGMANDWIEGESVPCRKGISIVELDKEEKNKHDDG